MAAENLADTVHARFQLCDAPAPVVVNGGCYAGCHLEKGHKGQHEVTVKWGG